MKDHDLLAAFALAAPACFRGEELRDAGRLGPRRPGQPLHGLSDKVLDIQQKGQQLHSVWSFLLDNFHVLFVAMHYTMFPPNALYVQGLSNCTKVQCTDTSWMLTNADDDSVLKTSENVGWSSRPTRTRRKSFCSSAACASFVQKILLQFTWIRRHTRVRQFADKDFWILHAQSSAGQVKQEQKQEHCPLLSGQWNYNCETFESSTEALRGVSGMCVTVRAFFSWKVRKLIPYEMCPLMVESKSWQMFPFDVWIVWKFCHLKRVFKHTA